MKREERGERYLMMDRESMPLARCLLESPKDSPILTVRVLEGKEETLTEGDTIRLVGIASGSSELLGNIVRKRNNLVMVEKLGPTGVDARQDLRMPTDFLSFVYPVSGGWRGRRGIKSKDLSCGGIAFYCQQELEIGEIFETVIPITAEPVLLKGKILRRKPMENDVTFYAAQFLDMCDGEKTIVREAVFNVQIKRQTSGQSSEGKGIGR